VLAYHARTEKQLRERLAKDGLSEVADEVIAWVTRLGYLDDRAYARARARFLLQAGKAGPRLAERRLQAAGIPAAEARATVAATLAEDGARAGDRELTLCRAALAKRLRGAAPASLDEKARARQARFLAGRGFSAGAVARALGLGWAPDEE
jgi:regulatory protein